MSRTEEKKAHEKMRLEIREAVKESLLKNGFTRTELRSLIANTVKHEAEKLLGEKTVNEALVEYARRELATIYGSSHVKDLIKREFENVVREEARRFFMERFSIDVAEKTGGDW